MVMNQMLNKRQAVAAVRMGRPVVVVAGLIAFGSGAAMAFARVGSFDLGIESLSLAIMVCAILMGHYANEYADVDTDSLTRRTLYSGGSGVLPSGIMPRSWALILAICFGAVALALAFASLLLGVLSATTVVMVLFGMLGGWLYSMPPLSLERSPYGEVDNAVLGGFGMTLMGYLPQAGGLDASAILFCIPLTLGVYANLLGVHWPDREADRLVGKRTMVVVLRERTPILFAVVTFAIYLTVLPLFFFGVPLSVTLSLFATIPVAVWAHVGFKRSGKPHFGSALMVALFIFGAFGWLAS
jgi:1,4-dihydroxy-2-naphthoate octaprenyltransferase